MKNRYTPWDFDHKPKQEIQNTFNCTYCEKFRQIFGRKKIGKLWACSECFANQKEKESV